MPGSHRSHSIPVSDTGFSLSPASFPATLIDASPLASGLNGGSAPGTTLPGVTILAPGEEPPASLIAALSSDLNPRSCVTCRRRKVRCDKHMPCSNCRRNQIQCVFPAPGRAPRRPRPKDLNAPAAKNVSEREAELLERLRKLEGIVDELSRQLDAEQMKTQSAGGSPDTNNGSGSPSQTIGSPTHGTPGSGISDLTSRSRIPRPRADDTAEGTGKEAVLTNKFGRLVLSDKAKGQYVANAFWSKLTEQLDEIRNETQSYSDDSDDYFDEGTPESLQNSVVSGSSSHQGFFYGFKSISCDLQKFHPKGTDIPFLWEKYCANVEPAVKIVHIPTWSKVIGQAARGDLTLPVQNQAMLFAIYFSAITSLEDSEIDARFGREKSDLLTLYRFAFEQALAQANFLTVPDFTIINALTLFLTVVRTSDDSRFCWTMSAVAVRLAEALGLQRDGTNLGLKPFEVEMRRRIWWVICSFDLRASEESGTDSAALIFNCDTKMPANINDADFGPESTEIVPREGATDISLALIRHEITNLCRKMISISNRAPVLGEPNALQSIQDREEALESMFQQIDAKHFQCADAEKSPLLILGAMILRVVMAKMSLVIYQPLVTNNKSKDIVPREVNDRVFVAAVEIIEYNLLLHTEERFRQWRWLFATYTQWHAITFVLMEMGIRPWTATMERGWEIVTKALNQREVQEFAKKPNHMTVWLPVKKLINKATRHRRAEVQRLRADPAEVQRLDSEDQLNQQQRRISPPKEYEQHTQQVRQRWLELVSPSTSSVPMAQPTVATPAIMPSVHGVPMAVAPVLQSMPSTAQQDYQMATDGLPVSIAGQPGQPLTAEAMQAMHQQHQDQQGQAVGLNMLMQDRMDTMILWDIIDGQSAMLDGMQMPRAHADSPLGPHGVMSQTVPPTLPSQHQQLAAAQQKSPHVQSQEALPVTVSTNPGPWAWSTNWYDTSDRELSSSIGTTANGSMAANGGMMMRDDQGMDMDEEFNWNDWNQSFRVLHNNPPPTYQGPTAGL
ncbi:hypothetical protein TD95_001269 [Thielaviopsis punctulata]|uniref:Zn(2)-C6 fungal-type domain-containing protein n=1 Tax=Thielaviopsis punctulata TaxID=72032 RepID=A0A0F4ZD22_9PEZI|nr:hypothetical protein TD95_001269 [Thielaviopsis punctulata]